MNGGAGDDVVRNSVFNEEENTWTVNGNITFRNIHPRSVCEHRNCIVHNPSDTPANRGDWPYVFREGHAGGRIERTCPCGIGHSDVDQVAFLEERYGDNAWGVHGCCLCCMGREGWNEAE